MRVAVESHSAETTTDWEKLTEGLSGVPAVPAVLAGLPLTAVVLAFRSYRCPKLLEYLLAVVPGSRDGGDSPGVLELPSTDAMDLLSARLDGPPRLDGPGGGEGLIPTDGEPGRRAAAPMGDGRPGARDDVGE